MTPAPPNPAQRLAAILLALIGAVDGPSMFGPFPRPLAILIMTRIMALKRGFTRLATKILAGTFVHRRLSVAPRRPAAPHQRRPNPLPHHIGWLPKLLPDTQVYAAHLSYLLDDPAMLDLIRAAPPALARPLRSLCRMLGVTPPPLLAIPRPPATPAPAAVPATPRRPAPPPSPPRNRQPHNRPPARASGPPRPHPA